MATTGRLARPVPAIQGLWRVRVAPCLPTQGDGGSTQLGSAAAAARLTQQQSGRPGHPWQGLAATHAAGSLRGFVVRRQGRKLPRVAAHPRHVEAAVLLPTLQHQPTRRRVPRPDQQTQLFGSGHLSGRLRRRRRRRRRRGLRRRRRPVPWPIRTAGQRSAPLWRGASIAGALLLPTRCVPPARAAPSLRAARRRRRLRRQRPRAPAWRREFRPRHVRP